MPLGIIHVGPCMQQAEVAELNRRAQHAEQESSAARAEAAAVRQAAAQQQAERAIAQYSHADRMAGLPFQDAQSAREYESLPGLGFPRYVFLQARVCVLPEEGSNMSTSSRSLKRWSLLI